MAIAMMALSSSAQANDPIKRLLDLQLRKGIITQQEYDEFMSATDEDSAAGGTTGNKAESGKAPGPESAEARKSEPGSRGRAADAIASKADSGLSDQGSDNLSVKAPATGSDGGVAVIKTDSLKVEVFSTIDLSVGYTSHSLVQNGEMPTSIGPFISGGVRYPRTTPTGPGGSSVPYPASNMSSQVGLFNGALSTSSWGIRATRDLGANGLKAFVVLDSAFNPATGQLTDQSHNQATNSRYPTTVYATSSLNGQIFAKEAVGGFSGDNWGR
ncbi:MAG TPA: hypothetical protein VF523_12570, partial [Burkholderiales bacterium]